MVKPVLLLSGENESWSGSPRLAGEEAAVAAWRMSSAAKAWFLSLDNTAELLL
jgi:hypothetical protein